MELCFYSFIAFVLAYFVAIGDLAFSEYPKSYQVAFRWQTTKALYLYGLFYGVIAVLLYLFLPLVWYDHTLVCDENNNCVKQYLDFAQRLGWGGSVMYAFACGVSTKGLTKFSPIDIPSNPGEPIPINLEQVLDNFTKFIKNSIALTIGLYSTRLIEETLDLIRQKNIDLPTLKNKIKLHFPQLTEAQEEEFSAKIDAMEEPAQVLKFFIRNFNIRHFENFKQSL